MGEQEQSITQDEHSIQPDGGDVFVGSEEWDASNADAHLANIEEHSMSVKDAILAYPWALIWSLLVSMSIIMEGYDTVLIQSFFGYPAFQKQFGERFNDHYEIAGHWQAAVGAGPIAGSIIGAFLNGYLVPHLGFRPVFMGGTIAMIAFIFPSFFGKSIEIQTVGQVLCGIPWGIFATIGPAYASELCPMTFRSYLTAYTNMCFAIGQFIGAGVLQSLLARDDEWSYRIAFALQWLWPVPMIVAAIFMPESPWWLARHGKYAEAEQTVQRLMSPKYKPTAKNVIAMMIHTNRIEEEIQSGSSYADCYRGSDLRRTEIACVAFAGQVLAGSQFAYSGTYFFQQAGMSPDDAYKLGLGGTAIAFIGTIIAWFLMGYFGRRRIYSCGQAMMAACLLTIGFLTLASSNNAVVWTQSALCIVWLFTFSLSVGPIGWAIPAEVSSTRLRSKTVVLARNSYYLALLVANVIQPYMMNPSEWNWKGKTGFFWFSFATLMFVWCFFRLPETAGRTYEELDLMFAARLPTRKFKTHQINAYENETDIGRSVNPPGSEKAV